MLKDLLSPVSGIFSESATKRRINKLNVNFSALGGGETTVGGQTSLVYYFTAQKLFEILQQAPKKIHF